MVKRPNRVSPLMPSKKTVQEIIPHFCCILFTTKYLAGGRQVVRVVGGEDHSREKDGHDAGELHGLGESIAPVAREKQQRDLKLRVVADARVLEQEGA